MGTTIQLDDGNGGFINPVPACAATIIVDCINGTDYGDGSVQYPVKTIEQASQLAQSSLSNNVYVLIKAGTYNVSSTITIDSPGKNINFIPEGAVEINWLKKVPCTLNNGVYTASCTTQPNLIYANGKRIYTAASTRPTIFSYSGIATLPATQNITKDGVNYIGIQLSDADVTALTSNDRYKYMWFTIFKWWTSQKLRCVSIDTINKLALIRIIDNGNGDTPAPGQGDKIIVENMPVPLALFGSTTPFTAGTFYYDNANVYYTPKSGEILDYIEVPIKGTAMILKSPVTFRGIKFRGIGYDFIANGYACIDTQGAYSIDGAFKCYGSGDSFIACEFTDIEQTCIEYLNGSSCASVNYCYFHNVGSSSVKIGEVNKKATNLPKNVEIRNCLVAYAGEILQQSCGVVMTFADHCQIEHNEILLVPYSAITSGHVWTSVDSDPETNFNNCSISYNKIHHYSAAFINDLGGIYNLGDTKGMKIIGNEIHHSTNGYGIYLDNGSSNIEVKNNKTWGVKIGVLINCWCQNDTIENNILANSRNMPVDDQVKGGTEDNFLNVVVKNNILYSNTATLLTSIFGITVEKNLWYGNSGLVSTIPAIGNNNVYGSPNFVDSTAGNFATTDRTNIDKIDFVDINVVIGVLKAALASYASACTVYENSYTGLLG